MGSAGEGSMMPKKTRTRKICSHFICILFGLFAFAISIDAVAAPNEPETYTRLNISLGGAYFSGNVNQVQANIQGHWAISSPTAGLDVLTNGYRLWKRIPIAASTMLPGMTYSSQPIHSGTFRSIFLST